MYICPILKKGSRKTRRIVINLTHENNQKKVENYELALLYSLPPRNFAGHPRCSLIGPAVSNKENNIRNKTSSNQFKAVNVSS
ncbi:hypothetical protein J6590_017769 [Homalodisca vitripennis]|nr:hypothetical protein J6590_017769 [Homalodisca vitripennis]